MIVIRRDSSLVLAGLLACLLVGQTMAAEQTEASPPAVQESASPEVPASTKPQKPFSFGMGYYLYSDYVFRGINFSEFPGEGREKPNHQMTTSLDVPLGKFGTIGFDTFFEWFAAQKELTGSGANIQEVDYTVRWSHDLEPIATTFTTGWAEFTFPNVSGVGDNDRTHEWFVSLEHNDAWMWRWAGYHGDDGVLNPTLFVAYDWHIARGVWIELGISHPFALTDSLTITPGAKFAVDGGYLGPLLGTDDHDFRYARTQFGLDATYDLTKVLRLPEWAGSVSISGQLYYDVPTNSTRHTGLDNEFWGGLAVNWNW
jgi:hypothetical protein